MLIYLIVTSLIVMIPGRKMSLILTGVTMFVLVIFSSCLAIDVLIQTQNQSFLLEVQQFISPLISCDKLSAFFILIINFTVVSGFLYSTGYLKPYLKSKPVTWIKLHYLALVWLHVSMIMVTLFRNGFYFLMVWEIMTLSSFILVIFEYDVKGTVKAGLIYLIQMHVGMLFILAAFIISSKGYERLTFDNLDFYFLNNSNWPVFLIFFIGFGLKAGFFFLHTWLPDAHPAAPSHVSGIMSGVMIKLGIYGILRVTTYLVSDLAPIGISVIILSAITGLFGVMMAILQHDIKKLLAYHSIENIGIIGLGIGLGIYGSAIGNVIVSVAGYAGALLHTLNHSLFKSLLFYSAGTVIGQVHTRDVEKMGGLIKFMPFTAWAFLIGAIAISGLPPFNGFISEFLIYISLFNGIGSGDFYPLVVFFIAMLSLVVIGGLAILCFTKVFSVMFLGQPRSEYHEKPVEAKKIMLLAKLLPVIPIVMIGFLPFIIIKPLLSLSGSVFNVAQTLPVEAMIQPMQYISIISVSLLLLITAILVVRKSVMRNRMTLAGPTWGCGYSSVDSKQQYTATSFIQEYSDLVKPVITTGHSKINYSDDEIFPGKRDFYTHSDDFVRSRLILKPSNFIVTTLKRAAIFQTGKLQHYVLYALIFLFLILALTFIGLI
ncbi:MAG TPA: proton-conducting transporter membrane subunit [Bacteroidales bacterium]|nr:proton-conducting transporter membrane subunit [Bacteroidales bacterium]HPT22415.1 proton-conducting transporter membrane subunit [Bacteroidales bacterium]